MVTVVTVVTVVFVLFGTVLTRRLSGPAGDIGRPAITDWSTMRDIQRGERRVPERETTIGGAPWAARQRRPYRRKTYWGRRRCHCMASRLYAGRLASTHRAPQTALA